MFEKIFILAVTLSSIEKIFNLNTDDMCSSFVCGGKHNYKCTKDMCSLNEKTCDDYGKFQRLNSFYVLRSFKIFLKLCETKKLTLNDYCVKNSFCLKQRSLGFISPKLKIDCKCEGKHSYKCGDFCTLDRMFCDLLNLKILYKQKLNKIETKICALP
jgi:hypothetical protein